MLSDTYMIHVGVFVGGLVFPAASFLFLSKCLLFTYL